MTDAPTGGVVGDPDDAAGERSLELGAGFDDDEVTVLVDGRPVWSGHGVATDYSIGLAAVVPLPPDARTVEVRLADGARASGPVAARTGPGTVLRAEVSPTGELGIGPAPRGDIF